MKHRRVTYSFPLLSLGLVFLFAMANAESSRPFKKIQISNKYWAEGVAIADINRDGHQDIISGPFWYEGPRYKTRHEIVAAIQTFVRKTSDGGEERIEGFEGGLGEKNAYSNVFFAFTHDFNRDGWPDVLTVGFPGTEAIWYENPGKEILHSDQHWRKHPAFDAVGNESPGFVDLFGNGQPVLLCMSGDNLGYVMPNWERPREKWTFYVISPVPYLQQVGQLSKKLYQQEQRADVRAYVHGLGFGDVNADGRLDVLAPDGWWEQPVSVRRAAHWQSHAWSFVSKYSDPGADRDLSGRPPGEVLIGFTERYRWPYALGGAQIHAADVNGDKLPDIISSLAAHGYGLAWFEQSSDRSANGERQFRQHTIMASTPAQNKHGVEFTQLHAVSVADMDGDGLKDIVTGKTFWAHGPNMDPQSDAPAVLYWFKGVRSRQGNADFVPYLVDADSGIGRQIALGDLNKDGSLDIAISNKKGTFAFLQER